MALIIHFIAGDEANLGSRFRGEKKEREGKREEKEEEEERKREREKGRGGERRINCAYFLNKTSFYLGIAVTCSETTKKKLLSRLEVRTQPHREGEGKKRQRD